MLVHHIMFMLAAEVSLQAMIVSCSRYEISIMFKFYFFAITVYNLKDIRLSVYDLSGYSSKFELL